MLASFSLVTVAVVSYMMVISSRVMMMVVSVVVMVGWSSGWM
jgi:hypothetical protein